MTRRAAPAKKKRRSRKLTAAKAREVFSYDKATGIVRWRINRRGHSCKGQRAGTIATNCKTGVKRRQICFEKRVYLEHRLIWLMVTGKWPRREIDHRNGKPLENRWTNLRQATGRQNRYNVAARARNQSGLKWVRTHRPGKYQATVGGVYLGAFGSAEAAHRCAARYARKKHRAFFNPGAPRANSQGVRM